MSQFGSFPFLVTFSGKDAEERTQQIAERDEERREEERGGEVINRKLIRPGSTQH